MKPTLLALAAGLGSRFGGLKQMAPVGPSGEWILDYALYDALQAGFGKAVFVIRPEMEAEFRAAIEDRVGDRLELAYAYQDPEDLPAAAPAAARREKPWGTGHAVYAARRCVDGPFAAINADDFYGRDAYRSLAGFFAGEGGRAGGHVYSLVAYDLANTLSSHGPVSRGVCRASEDSFLEAVEEHTEIERRADGAIVGRDGRGRQVVLDPDTPASLNCWGFPAQFFGALESELAAFLAASGADPKREFYLPAAVDSLTRSGKAKVRLLPCRSQWLGVTHKADLPAVQQAVRKLVEQGVYPSPLWG